MNKHFVRIKILLKDKNTLTILHNFASLSALNVINLLLPLLTLPYLVRVIGVEKYGLVSFVLVVVQYLVLLLNYGFPLSATKQVAESKMNKKKISEIVSNILIIKFFFGTGLFVLLLSTLHVLRIPNTLYIYSVGIIFGEIFNFTWLYQGMERMKYVTIVNSISKGLFTVLIFVFITSKNDYSLICVLTSVGYMVAGLSSLVIAYRIFNLQPKFPSMKEIHYQIKDGWLIFLSTLGINLYRNSNIFILGLLTNDSVVGIYSASEKVIKALQSPISALSEALFPYFSRKMSESNNADKGINSLLILSKYYSIVLGVYVILVLIFANYLTKLLLGNEFMSAVINIQIMSAVILIGSLNYLFGIVGMVNLNMKKQFAKYVLISGVVGIIIVSSLSKILLDLAGTFAFLASESVLFLLTFITIIKYKSKLTI